MPLSTALRSWLFVPRQIGQRTADAQDSNHQNGPLIRQNHICFQVFGQEERSNRTGTRDQSQKLAHILYADRSVIFPGVFLSGGSGKHTAAKAHRQDRGNEVQQCPGITR